MLRNALSFHLMWVVLSGAVSGQCTNGLIYDCHQKYPKESPTLCMDPRACVNKSGSSQMHFYSESDDVFRKQMLDIHNERRREVLDGSNRSDMMEVTWAEELARGALNYLMKLCVDYDRSGRSDFEAPHAKCGDTYNYRPTGQIIHIEAASEFSGPQQTGEQIGTSLKSNILPQNATESEAERAQILWSRTYKIGCAYITAYNKYVACNYAHAGAIPGEYIFNLTAGCPAGSVRGDNFLCQVSDENLLRSSLNVTSL